MSDSVYELVEKSCQTLRLDLSSLEFAKLAEEYDVSVKSNRMRNTAVET